MYSIWSNGVKPQTNIDLLLNDENDEKITEWLKRNTKVPGSKQKHKHNQTKSIGYKQWM